MEIYDVNKYLPENRRGWMSEKKKEIGFTVACINEFAQHYNLSIQEAFRYLFQFKGIAFIKENYEVEHTLDFETIIEDLAMCRPYKDFGKGFYLTDIKEQAEKMAVRLSKIYGGSPVVNTFIEIDHLQM